MRVGRPCRRPGLRPVASHADRRVGGREALPPARIAQRPAQLALGLRVRGSTSLVPMTTAASPAARRASHDREAPRRLGAEDLGELRQPFAHRRRVVVDDVRRSRAPRGGAPGRLPRRRRRGGSTRRRRSPSPTIGNLRLRTRSPQPSSGGAVEGAVAQGDPAEAGDSLVEMGHRREGLAGAGRRGRVERIVLSLDGPHPGGCTGTGRSSGRRTRRTPASQAAARSASVPRVRSAFVPRQHACRGCGRTSRSPGAVASCTIASGPLLEHGLAHGTLVEQVEQHRLGAERSAAPRRSPASCGFRSPHARRRSAGERAGRPRIPLAPATNTRIVSSFRSLSCHIPRISRVYFR